MSDDWSFAASAHHLDDLTRALDESSDFQVRNNFPGNTLVAEQVRHCTDIVAALLDPGLWGVGPFSVAISGNESSVYISIKAIHK